MLALSGRDGGGRRRGGNGRARLTLEYGEEEAVQRSRFCRVIIAVDVSYSMVDLIDAVVGGILEINEALNSTDLVSVIDFAEKVWTIFPYIQRRTVDWDILGDTLKTHVKYSSRGTETALWDAIGHTIDTTRRNKKYREYKTELVIFTDGYENCSAKHTYRSFRYDLGHPGIPHVHITIIDASGGANGELKAICAPVQHCSFLQVEASHEAVQRAFTDVTTAITRRLTVAIEPNDLLGTLSDAFSHLNIGPRALPSEITADTEDDGGNGGGRDRGRRRGGRGRGRGRGAAN